MDSEIKFLELFSTIMDNNSDLTRIIKRDRIRNQTKYKKRLSRNKPKSEAERQAEARIKNLKIPPKLQATTKLPIKKVNQNLRKT